MSFLSNITESGVSRADTNSEKRNVVLTNYISLVAVSAILLLLIGRFFLAHVTPSIVFTLLQGCVLFLLPILINRLGYINASRLVLCWIPALYQLYSAVYTMHETEVHETSTYVGLRFFLLAFSCFPFLVFDMRKRGLFFAGLLGPLLSILSFDPILTLFGYGYRQVGLSEQSYYFNNIRILVSFLVIGTSSYLLKKYILQSEQANEVLLVELAEKNKLLQQKASEEVLQLNDQLYTNLQYLSEREFLLNQSQRLAKVGSWEYRVAGNYIFWSDEMYNIFGLDKSFDLKSDTLGKIMWGDQSDIMIEATVNLLRTGKPFDITLRTRTPLGYKKWVRVCAFPVLEHLNVVAIRAICHDITIYKEAEEQLRTTEQKFAKAFQNNPDLMTILREEDLMIFDVNEKAESVIGYRRDELLGQPATRFQFFAKDDERRQFFEQYFAHGKVEMECTWRKKDGGSIYALISSSRMELDGIKYLISIIKDITDRKMAEERFQKSFDLNPDLMLIFRESDGVIVDANSKLETLTYFQRQKVVGYKADALNIWLNPKEFEVHKEEYYRVGKAFHESLMRKNGGEVFYGSVSSTRIQFSGENHVLVVVRDITDRKLAEVEKEAARHALNERIKELTTLYKAGQILHQENKEVDLVLTELLSIIPEGWQYPEITAARIVIGDKQYSTLNFTDGYAKQSQEFLMSAGSSGVVEIVYLEKTRSEVEGPFLAEERNLLNMVAEMLRSFFAHQHETEELNRSEANLHATINNTEVLIWSIDRNFRLLTFNKPFADYMSHTYGKEIKFGSRIFEADSSESADQLSKKWTSNYMRALAGEIITLEETRFGIDFQYSLSPIVEGDQIIGVSIFADNVTERKTRDRELAEAIEKIGELKLMALRSVMSPHFIFNVLNSIQYFIAKNDRLNAINYLSTFSKLIRSILTHSVNNKIKLTDEIEMLKNYVSLEMIRFENKFDFSFEVSPEVEIDSIEIPSLLIQPYVENAILHGLYNKTTKGTLTLRVFDEGEAVIFEIEDDGVGREAAIKLRQQNFPSHKSMGIKLTEERLKLINQQHHAAFEIEDLSNEHGPSGTRVRIRVITG